MLAENNKLRALLIVLSHKLKGKNCQKLNVYRNSSNTNPSKNWHSFSDERNQALGSNILINLDGEKYLMDTIDLATVAERCAKLPETQRYTCAVKQFRSPPFEQIK